MTNHHGGGRRPPTPPPRSRDGRAGRWRPARDRGSATVWAAAGVSVIMTTLLVGLHLGAAVIARHRAEAAADLAALAAAGVAVEGVQTACDRAGEVAAAMAGTVTSCRLVGWDALVEVHVPAAVTLPGSDGAAGRARAGPVPSTSASDAAPPVARAPASNEPAAPPPIGRRTAGPPPPSTTSGRPIQMDGPAHRDIRLLRSVRGPPDDSAHHVNARRDFCTDQRRSVATEG